MYSPRGVMMLAHNVHDVQVFKRHVHANRLNGIDNEWLTPEQAKAFCPPLNISPDCALPGRRRGALQRRGGTARHDAVAWGYARGARSARGVDIIQNCEVTGIERSAERRGRPASRRRAASSARRRSASSPPAIRRVVMAMAGVRLPIESYPLQALVSEPVKPVFPCVVMSNTVHAYISQSDKGELVIGAGTDAYISYTQTGGLHISTHTLDAICELFPIFRAPEDAAQLGRHRRCHAGPLADHRQDAGAGPLRQLRLGHRRLQGDAGLGPCLRARPSPAASRTRSPRPFTLERFRTGRLIDEAAAAAVAH